MTKKNTKNLISIVIPTWNGVEYLKICLESLNNQTNREFEVIVVDNGSSDGTKEYIKNYHKEVRLIGLEKNFGFALAVNTGIKKSTGDYVFLLNNDIELKSDCVEVISKEIKLNNVDVLACRMMDFSDRRKVLDIGNTYSVYGYAIQEGRGLDEKKNIFEKKKIFSACAGAAIYNKKVFEKIGYFDEDYFAYLEDLDLGFRLQLAGYETFLLPDSVIYHIEGGTSERFSDFKEYYSLRNNLFLITKNIPTKLLLFLLPFIFIYQIRTIIVFLRKGKVKVFFKAYFSFFKNFKKNLKKRGYIQRSKIVSDYYIFKKLSKKNPFALKKYFLTKNK